MKLRIFAEIATIIGVTVAILTYMKVEPNVLDKIPEIHQEKAAQDVAKIDLSINDKEYEGEKASLYHQYRAAIAMENSYTRDSALSKVIDAALKIPDFKIAILAGKKIDNSYTKSTELTKVVEAALKQEGKGGHAVVAAELIPNSYSKDSALGKIISFYEHGPTYEKTPEQLTELEKYKEIYTFADSSAHMNMSEKEAKTFADQWQKDRTYSDFLYFKKIFTFADSSADMNMSVDDAMKFAIRWIENYSPEDFELFAEAFKFADSSAGMSMSEKEAELFAFRKLKEHKKANKANAADAKSRAAD